MFDADDLRFLADMTRDVVEASRVRPGQRVGDSPVNTQAHVLIRPGGRAAYPAMWVRDFAMSLESGFITDEEIRQHLAFVTKVQNGPYQRNKKRSGAIVPPFAIPDHINFDGGPVFYPGTYSTSDDQGGEPYGVLPPADDQYDYVHIAHHLWQRNQRDGLPIENIKRAFDAVQTDPATGGMVSTTAKRRAVGFGFCDGVFLTGSILFASLLRWRAAREMVRIVPEQADTYNRIAEDIAGHVAPVFADPTGSGWLLAATDVGRRRDVWGTLYALHLQILSPKDATAARNAVIDAVKAGTITLEGAVRHIPTDNDASPTSAWEQTAGLPLNRYQNGAYWHTPTGWLLSALHRHEPVMAKRIFKDFVAHLRDQDFRKGDQFGAPWECFHRDGAGRQNPIYMASVTTPLAAIRRIEGE